MTGSTASNFDLQSISAAVNDTSATMGYLEWHTVSKCETQKDILKSKLRAHGFESYMPKEISPSDAFRRATSDIQKSKVETGNPDLYQNFLVREVYSDRFEIVRKIVIETVDKAGKALAYEPEEATIRYDKKLDTIEYTASSKVTEDLISEALSLWEKYKETYTERHIREVCFNILQDMSPISVKPSGGVYFIPESYSKTLISFLALVNELGESEGFKVPVIRNDENTDMVRRKLQDHIKSAIFEAAEVLKGECLKGVANAKLTLVKQVITDFSEYQRVLQDELADMDGSLELLKAQARKIVEKLSEYDK